MVKKMIAFGIMLIMLFSLFAFAGCVEDGTFPGLSAKTENKIKQTYLDELHAVYSGHYSLEDIVTEHYCGTYNGYIVAMMSCTEIGHLTVCASYGETVAGVDFWYPYSDHSLRAWKNGKFNTLTEAYNNGWLTEENIKSISDIYKSQREK